MAYGARKGQGRGKGGNKNNRAGGSTLPSQVQQSPPGFAQGPSLNQGNWAPPHFDP